MSTTTLDTTLCWYAIHTQARDEIRAESNLMAWKVETFAPKLKESRYRHGVLFEMVKPLFPRYIFARFNAEEMLHKVRFTRGVSSVVSFGGSPVPVEDQIIDLIKVQRDEEGFISIGETLKAGDVVRIKDGPLKNMLGIFEYGVKHSDRVMLLLTTINYQSHLMIDRTLVQRNVA
jgi:transcriptional antiterminator RfaH